MGKQDGQSRRSGEEISGIDAHFYDEGQLLDVENDNVGKGTDVKDVELEEIDVAI